MTQVFCIKIDYIYTYRELIIKPHLGIYIFYKLINYIYFIFISIYNENDCIFCIGFSRSIFYIIIKTYLSYGMKNTKKIWN